MPKQKTVYICNSCAKESLQWFGRCPACGAYNSLEETQVGGSRDRYVTKAAPSQARSALRFSEISDQDQGRLPSGYGELDRVLGGGIVPGSLVLIGGDPGIGKSTLLLQVANQLASQYRILYITGEESRQQIKLRAARLGVTHLQVEPSDPNLYILAETDLEQILAELVALRPKVAIVDSIQTIYLPGMTSAPGSIAQVRECTSALMQVAKREQITLLIVGHITKEGAIAGPRVLEYLVDTVLYFEGDRYASHRLLRSVKNRFGATQEIGVFAMADQGLREVTNPSELFLGNPHEPTSGSTTIVACEGTRPIVAELQALVSPSSYASPRRSTTGVDYNRLLQVLAVLEKRLGIPLSKLDAYVATAGGLGVEEPAADLGMAVALVASFRDRTVDARTVVIGEVGLGGQVRPTAQLEMRLKEAAKLGFQRAIIPRGQELPDLGLEITPVGRVVEAIMAALGRDPQ
jgi:DNA repair protein RadA/Sms